MTIPLHHFPASPIALSVDEAHRRLTADAQGVVVAATADVLDRCTPTLRRWGVVPRALPTVATAATDAGELGAVAVRWRGDEAATGWPAMSARLLLTPTRSGGCELTLATTRAPSFGLAVTQVGRVHGERAVHVLVAAFLRSLATSLEHAPIAAPAALGAAR
jgi:hypothetical protein